MGGYIEDADARSVGNTRALRESALVEAFNLKAAIEYVMKVRKQKKKKKKTRKK